MKWEGKDVLVSEMTRRTYATNMMTLACSRLHPPSDGPSRNETPFH